jgi:hypothetical protein
MLDKLNNYDWAEAFGEGTGGNCKPLGFTREEVAEILLAREGKNDGADWIFVGRLHDGRYAVVEAGCDYTGWDCQAGNSGWTYPDHAAMLAGVGDEIRDLLGCPSDLQRAE